MLQKIDSLIERKWRYALILPLLFLGLHMYAFNTYPVMIPNENNTESIVDTIPEVKHMYQIDTTTVFDYDTGKETVQIIRRKVTDTYTSS